MLAQTRGTIAAELPRQVYIEVTNRCNSLCEIRPLTYDHFLPIEPKHHLNCEQFRSIVDQLPLIEHAVLHGIDEPLLNPDLPRFVTANSSVQSCCIAPFSTTDYPHIVLGNAFQQPLAEIWNDKPYVQLREAVLSENSAPCQHCGVRWSL